MLMSDLKIGEHTYDLYDDDAHKEIHSLDSRVRDLEEGGVIPGPPGPAGFSPEAEVHRLTATESIFTVTDKKGTTSDYYYGIQNDSLSINKWGSSVPLPLGILVEL